jgi:hypothetical protein
MGSTTVSDFVRADVVHRVPIQGGELLISPSMDFLHHFPNGAWVLKYWDSENDPPRFCNVFMHEDSANYLVENCDVEVMPREFMGTAEHEQYLGWAATQLTELDFTPEEDS